MDYFYYQDGVLYAENVAVTDIAAAHGTPCFIYSRATLERHWRAFDSALDGLDHLVCYAVKANSNLAVLNVLARLGSGSGPRGGVEGASARDGGRPRPATAIQARGAGGGRADAPQHRDDLLGGGVPFDKLRVFDCSRLGILDWSTPHCAASRLPP